MVASRILLSAQVEEQLAVWGVADVVVRDRCTLAMAGRAVDQGVLDSSSVGEGGLEVEVDLAVGAGSLESEVGQGVRGGGAWLGADLESSRCRKGDRGKENGGDGGEAHFDGRGDCMRCRQQRQSKIRGCRRIGS